MLVTFSRPVSRRVQR